VDERMNDLKALAVLDPARDSEPTAQQWARSRAFVERTMAGEATRSSSRVTTRRWLTAGAAAVAVGAVAVVAVPVLFPSAGEQAVASWTAMPSARTGEQVLPQARKCAANRTGGRSTTVHPADVLLAEQRGDATLLILRKETGITVECLLLGDDGLNAMPVAGPEENPAPPVGSVSIEAMSSAGSGDKAMSEIIGLADPKVTGVQVRLDSGRIFQASVRGGWWGAWWPGKQAGEVGDKFTIIVYAGDRSTSYRPSELL